MTPGSGFALQHTYDLSKLLPAGKDCLIALMPDWSGHIRFVTHDGNPAAGTLDPATGRGPHRAAGRGDDHELVLCGRDGRHAFVVTDYALYRFDISSSGAPVVTWRQVYDRGSVKKPGQLEQQGSRHHANADGQYNGDVAITDNADHADARRRLSAQCLQAVVPRSTSRRSSTPGTSDTENSLVAAGSSLIAENNYGYARPRSPRWVVATTRAGHRRSERPGPSGLCSLAWTTSQQIAPTSVAKASLASGLLYAYTKPKTTGIDAWYLTAIDLRTGATVFSKLAGTGPEFNNHYAAIYLPLQRGRTTSPRSPAWCGSPTAPQPRRCVST